MEQLVDICGVGVNLYGLTNTGRLFRFEAGNPPSGPGAWIPIVLPAGIGETIEPIDHGGRMHKGYYLKKHRNQLFFWEREEDHKISGFFERQEAAIADSRTDYMLRHRPAPAPKPEQPVP